MSESSPKKTLGQHWLHDKTALQAMVEAANVQAGDKVLEIGPGLGTLTDELLAVKANVTALEYDHELVIKLRQKYRNRASTEIEIQEGDVRTYDFGNMAGSYKIVANIPYYLTANLCRALIDTPQKPEVAALLVQKEVAQRLAAKPGQLSFLAVALQLFYQIRAGEVIPAFLFTPPPKVDSQIVTLQQRPEPLFGDVDMTKFLGLIKAGFSAKRKKLKTSLATGVIGDKDAVEAVLAKTSVSPDVRAQELTLRDWHEIYQASQ